MDLKEIWKNKSSIAEGLKNNMFKKEHIEVIAHERLKICLVCPFYDPTGTSEKATFKGKPSCASCGCLTALKTRCLSCDCPENKWLKITDDHTSQKIKNQIKKSK